MKRFGITNKNIVAKFVEAANKLDWPVYINRYKLLERDELFPEIKFLAKEGLDDYGHYYQLEKQNGRWQIQKVDTSGVFPVTGWLSTRPFIAGLTMVADIIEEKRDQV